LRTGTFQCLQAGGGIYAFARTLPGRCAVVIFNTQTRAVTMDVDVTGLVPAETSFEDFWNQGRHMVTQQRLYEVTIPAREAVVFVRVEDGAVRCLKEITARGTMSRRHSELLLLANER
jgi:hypothetical protein